MVPQEQTSGRWYELPLPKSLSIVRCATGHDGSHAVLVDTDGASFFAGLARRGEDGDLSIKDLIIYVKLMICNITTLCCSQTSKTTKIKSP